LIRLAAMQMFISEKGPVNQGRLLIEVKLRVKKEIQIRKIVMHFVTTQPTKVTVRNKSTISNTKVMTKKKRK
jgi:hypothetical protein